MMDIKQRPLRHSKPVMPSPLLLQGSQDTGFYRIPCPYPQTQACTCLCAHTAHPHNCRHTQCFQVYTDENTSMHFHTYIKSFALFFQAVFAHLEYTMPWRHETARRYHGGRFPVISMGNHSVVFALLWGGGDITSKAQGRKSKTGKWQLIRLRKEMVGGQKRPPRRESKNTNYPSHKDSKPKCKNST